MPRTLIWAIPGFIAWAALPIAAIQFCTDWRHEKAKYGFGALAGLLIDEWVSGGGLAEKLRADG
jgi:hypothetical protein